MIGGKGVGAWKRVSHACYLVLYIRNGFGCVPWPVRCICQCICHTVLYWISASPFSVSRSCTESSFACWTSSSEIGDWWFLLLLFLKIRSFSSRIRHPGICVMYYNSQHPSQAGHPERFLTGLLLVCLRDQRHWSPCEYHLLPGFFFCCFVFSLAGALIGYACLPSVDWVLMVFSLQLLNDEDVRNINWLSCGWLGWGGWS